jgi:hypothetical protein
MTRQFVFAAVLAISVAATASPVALAAKPSAVDPSYANGTTVYMIDPHLMTNPSPGLYARAEELYLAVYPINADGRTDLGAQVLPSGYRPQCDPCFHPGLPPVFGYHDHVLAGAPGFGTNGTAGDMTAPWKVILVVYDPAAFTSPTFHPVTSVEQLDWAEEHGWFLPINAGADNPFEVETGQVLICPLVSPSVQA